MTTWLVAHTDRFKAAISERACNAFDSFEGSSDIGWLFVPLYIGADPARIAAQSPLAYADRIRTPMLLIHSSRTGAARSSRPSACSSPSARLRRAAAVPRRGPRADPLRPAQPPRGPVRGRARLVGRHLKPAG